MQGSTATVAAAEQQGLECPRCRSTNTKFCYYNNYNLSQPRHFCKDCRRYWTKGGALRNVPVGGGSRKNSAKRPSSSAVAAADAKRSAVEPASGGHFPKPEPISVFCQPVDPDQRMLDITGSFSSLLASNGGFGGLLDGFPGASGTSLSIGAPGLDLQSSTDSSGNENAVTPSPAPENLLGSPGDSACWAAGWTELAIFTPGSSFP